jgi:polyhydroxyalkanoate synthase
MMDTDVTYLLTSGGHNVGIVSEPGSEGHSFQVMTKRSTDYYVDPETFVAEVPRKNGSWWPEWVAWLVGHAGPPAEPPAMGAVAAGYPPLCEAPGTYVLQA